MFLNHPLISKPLGHASALPRHTHRFQARRESLFPHRSKMSVITSGLAFCLRFDLAFPFPPTCCLFSFGSLFHHCCSACLMALTAEATVLKRFSSNAVGCLHSGSRKHIAVRPIRKP